MRVLQLSRAGERLRSFPLVAGALVGSSRHCDIVVPDGEVAPKAYRVVFDGALPVLQALDGSTPSRSLTKPVALGAFELVCRNEDACVVATQVQAPEPLREHAFALLIGRGANARTRPIGGTPLILGAAPDCDVVLEDRAVSRRHCALQVTRDGLVVRDLGSRNGTWVDGRRVLGAIETVAATLRLGRSELRVVPRRQAEPCTFVAESAAMVDVMATVQRFARFPYPALILGESGAGKEHIARALHDLGPRRDGPFVAVNGGAFASGLIESELFGHERGAFTGATQRHAGAFVRAEGGTLFLDEVGELPLVQQTRLLRVLENWTVRALGAADERKVDVRLVCATNRNPDAMVAAGQLRRDLYHRIRRLVVRVPPLRRRREDIPALVELFLREFAEHGGHRSVADGAMRKLMALPFPGNVRELRNIVQTLAASCDHRIEEEHVERLSAPFGASPAVLRRTLASYGGNVSAAARAMGVPRSTLRDRLRRLERGEKDAA